VKQIGGGQYAERVDIERFNAPLISEYRGILDDIARETGGRRSQSAVELTGPGGGPVQTVEVTPDRLSKARRDALEFEKQLLEGTLTQPEDDGEE
jgi:hypothetical protein